MDSFIDPIEKLLAESNKDKVTLIGDGLTKQYFIEIDSFVSSKGKLYETQIKGDWNNEPGSISKNQRVDIFPTEVNEKVLADAKNRRASKISGLTTNMSITNIDRAFNNSLFVYNTKRSYMTDRPDQIKEDLLLLGKEHYNKALTFYKEGEYEKAILAIEKAFSFNSSDAQFYLLKSDCYIQLCDFKSAILSINKLISIISIYNDDDSDFEEFKSKLEDKVAFCYYMIGQTNYDSKLYLEAFDAFNKAGDIRPTNLTFKIKSISCLHAMNRLQDAINLMEKIINENESYKNNSNLYVLRARLYLKENNVSKCFYDLKHALKLNSDNKEASNLMEQLQDTAELLRNSGLILSLSNRITDALNKLTGAIAFDPGKAEYHLQRGILFKRLKDFNSAIDDFLLGLEKINEFEIKDPTLFANFQRQILLTYNDFAIQCYEKRFYDDAIVLLNKAIKIEKSEKGFYINRGDCFYKKDDRNFALLDYEQANEIDPNDEEIKDRIAKINYEIAIEKYNEKIYDEATKHFSRAIEMLPNKCKYYISRARTRYFCDDKYGAQKDICISILLEPSNPEIPNIISRIFVDQNLNDVLESKQMKDAKDYLREFNIVTVFENNHNIKQNLNIDLEKERKQFHLFPCIEEVLEEEAENMKIINEKRKLKKKIKESVKINLKPDIPKLKPIKLDTPKNKKEVINLKNDKLGAT